MMSLFSSFDLMNQSLPFLVKMIFIFFFMNQFVSLNFHCSLFTLTMSSIQIFFLSLKETYLSKSSLLIFVSLMVSILFLNYLSVFPYYFALTSQFGLVLFVSLTVWFSFVLISLFKNLKGFIFHCVPQGTPIYMAWFIFLVELISLSIRPVTLTIRLMANILAGHLLMILLSKLVLFFSPLIVSYYILNVVEIFVAFIQAYIFATLIFLYYSEAY